MVLCFVDRLPPRACPHIMDTHPPTPGPGQRREDQPAAAPSVADPPSSRGLSARDLSCLPAFPYAARETDPHDCAVCLTRFEENQPVRSLPGCGHLFHGHCVDPWLGRRATCPVCRSPVEPATPPLPSSGIDTARRSPSSQREELRRMQAALDRMMESMGHIHESLDRMRTRGSAEEIGHWLDI